MTEKERYEIILGELAEAIKKKSDVIALQSWQLADLKNKLAIAEQYNKKGGETAKKII